MAFVVSAKPAPGSEMTLHSVVIKCLNGAATLPETLSSLAAQQYPPDWEVVLADNGSTDGTQAIFADWAARHPGIRARLVDASARRGRADCLNIGIRAAAGNRLVFVDADDTVEPGWLAAMARALDAHELVAARLDTRRLNPDWTATLRPAEQDCDLPRMPHAPYCGHAGGATLGFHRHVFDALDGFDPALPSLEDEDFCVRAHLAGFVLRLVPDAVYNYRFRSEPAALYRQARDYAHARALIRRRYGALQPRLAPEPWLALVLQLAMLTLARTRQILFARGTTEEERGRASRKLGKAWGDLTGALAYGVAPPPRARQPLAGVRRRMRKTLRPILKAIGAAARLLHRMLRSLLRRARVGL